MMVLPTFNTLPKEMYLPPEQAAQAARHQPPVLSVSCGAGLWPAGCRQGWPAADAGVRAHPVLGSVEKAV
jgi:hypothetical protein